MKTLRAWLVFAWVFLRYLPWRAGLLRRRAAFTDYPEDVPLAVTQLFRWNRRVRVVNAHLCPPASPALFVANHHKLDDPIDLWPGIHWGSHGAILPAFVMRDDFFRGFPWNCLPYDPNHLCEMTGAVLISRDQLKLAQLRQLLGALAGGGALVLFPGRTRSRTGAWFEYRDDFAEPGSAAFVIGHAQRRHPELRIPAVPVTRTWHPVHGTTAVVFGEPLFLAPDAGREGQRALDCELLCRIGGLAEVHAVHLTALLLYLHALHRGSAPLPEAELERALRDWAAAPAHPLAHPAIGADAAGECRAAAGYFQRSSMLERRHGNLMPSAERILACPEWTGHYRDENPVKYWANQMLHLPQVVRWAEDRILANPPQS